MKYSPRLSSCRAFSLVELLVVVAVIGVMSVASAPFVSDLRSRDGVNSSAGLLKAELVRSREYAIAKNTHVWVLLSEPSSAEDAAIVSLASRQGVDSLGWGSAEKNLDASQDYEYLDQVRRLPMVNLRDPGAADIEIASLPSVPAEELASMGTVNVRTTREGKTLRFTRAIHFYPTGEARSGPGLVRYIEVALLPQRARNQSNQAAARVAGITGQVTVYRN